VTNLPESGELAYTNEEIGEIYRRRWQIELLWKFLKMHLKLSHLITKNKNGIRIQIYACLICYFLLQLVEIPSETGNKLLDKLRYLQAFMCEKISYVHWFNELVFNG
jgi:IS4 transposase